MGQAGIAYHHATAYEGIYSYSSCNFCLFYSYGYQFSYEVESYGFISGLAFGYQTFVGKRKRFTFDTYLGLQKLIMSKNLDAIYVNGHNGPSKLEINLFNSESPYNKGVFKMDDNTGIGGYINCGINLGYRF
jgi:hypothetical protein